MAWIFFRAPNITYAIDYISKIFNKSAFHAPQVTLKPFVFIIILIIIEWLQRDKKHALAFSDSKISKPLRWVLYYTLIIIIFWFGAEKQEFIYFQF